MGSIPFKAGSVGPTKGWDNTEAENGIFPLLLDPNEVIDLLHNFQTNNILCKYESKQKSRHVGLTNTKFHS